MRNNLKQFIHGVGSIIEIYPPDRYNKIIPPQTTEQRLNNSWQRVKVAFTEGLIEYENEQKNNSQK